MADLFFLFFNYQSNIILEAYVLFGTIMSFRNISFSSSQLQCSERYLSYKENILFQKKKFYLYLSWTMWLFSKVFYHFSTSLPCEKGVEGAVWFFWYQSVLQYFAQVNSILFLAEIEFEADLLSAT